ncbi:MAG: hypothetical protein HOY71_35050 [Nonomuraea sp.]|nr:hypothetical protein [Nonomuraea sp.]
MGDIREDFRATLDARRELGPDYEAALVDSFVDKVEEAIRARGLSPSPPPPPPPARNSAHTVAMALGSMALGIPIVAIGAATAGLVGLLAALLAVVLINVAVAGGLRR